MRTFILACTLWLISAFSSSYADVKVVTSIKPVHSLVSAVMEGVGEPYLIVKSSGSPHTYNMKPSDARAVQGADLVFWIGDGLESFLKRPLRNLTKKQKTVELWKSKGLRILRLREKREWSAHSHHHHHGHHHDKHASDMHIWLSPANAKAMVREIALQLSKADEDNRSIYEKNRDKVLNKLDLLSASMRKQLSSYGKIPFIVFHDSYQYLENEFGMSAAGSITLSPEVQLGARHLSRLQKYIKKHKIGCLFSEPQFNARTTSVLANNLGIKTGVLDPMGATIKDGSGLYFQMMENNAKALVTCLGNK